MKLLLFSLLLALPLAARAQSSTAVADVRTDGNVKHMTVLPDGSMVLTGFTTFVNNTPLGGTLIRITQAGTLVPGWNVVTDNGVFTSATDGTWVYLGGPFTVVNGYNLPGIARVSVSTGAVDAAWRPAPDGDVSHIVLLAAGGVVIAGEFTEVQGIPRRRLARLYTSGTGSPIENWRCDTQETVNDLLESGSWIYVAGAFGSTPSSGGLGGSTVNFLGRVNPGSGAVDTSWRPQPDWLVNSLATSGSQLYAGGSFNKMSGLTRRALARIVLPGGTADSGWNPDVGNLVTAVAVSNGAVFISGSFERVGNFVRKGFAKFNPNEAQPDSAWNPAVEGIAYHLLPDGAGGVWMGGRFHTGATAGGGWARVAGGAGSELSYPARIESRGSVDRLLSDGTWWYAGGLFDTVNGVRRPALFRYSAAGVVDAGWDAGLGGPEPFVKALEFAPGGANGPGILVGGQFLTPAQIPPARNVANLARINLADASTQTEFVSNPNSAVNAILRWNGGFLIGGEFTGVQPQGYSALLPFTRLGWVDDTGAPGTGPDLAPNAAVNVLFASQGRIYVGGDFTSLQNGGFAANRRRLFRMDGLFAIDLGWNPLPNGPVLALEGDATRVFAGGQFTRIGRKPRRHLAALSGSGAGDALTWRPDPPLEVDALRSSASHLYVGGAFFDIAQQTRGKLARFNLTDLTLDPAWLGGGGNGQVTSIELASGNGVWVGGSFITWDGSPSKRTLVRITGTAAAAPQPAFFPAPVDDPAADLAASYFAINEDGQPLRPEPLLTPEGQALSWQIRPGAPPGTVERVQWSHDLQSWHESGESADGTTRTIRIKADGTWRTACVDTSSSIAAAHPLFLRVLVSGRPAGNEEVQP